MLAQALFRNRSDEEGLALYRECVPYFLRFTAAARRRVETDLFAVDTRTRDLGRKLAVGA